MASRGVEIAIALQTAFAAAYGSGLVSQNIVVTRTWCQVTKKDITAFPPFDHSNIVENSVRVFIMSMPEVADDQGDTRAAIVVDYPIQVGIAAYLKTSTPADVDPLTQVSQELRDYCRQLTDPAYQSALGIPEGVTGAPEIVCDPDYDAILSDKLFLSVFTLSFTGGRTR